MRKFDAGEATRLIEKRSVSVIHEFTPILDTILGEHKKENIDVSSLRTAIGLETAACIEKYQEITGGTFCSLYGQTEVSGFASIGHYSDSPGSVGKPVPLAEVILVDGYDQPVPTGLVGEITVKGPLVFKGYWNRPADNLHMFRNDRHHTGDLGRFDEQGFLWYEGRLAEKELIKPGGENVYPAEVENIILQHPAIDRVVVFGVPDPKWKEAIKAVCQLKAGRYVSPEAIIDFVGERLARFKKPQCVEFGEDFPILENGETDRGRIKALYGG
ncbi:MAG: AMP-binding protein [Deltaproteobacteria bacterium]|nr:AMP-binding protein [Deltaproteobacteria bacterium]